MRDVVFFFQKLCVENWIQNGDDITEMLKHILKYILLCLRMKINIGDMLGFRDFERLGGFNISYAANRCGVACRSGKDVSYTLSVH
jgi:hypothetical protein